MNLEQAPQNQISLKPGAPQASLGVRFSGNTGLVVLLGGTSARFILLDGQDNPSDKRDNSLETVRVPWEKFRALPANQGRDIAPLADEFIDYSAGEVVSLMERCGIDASQVKQVGLAVAGQVEGTGLDTRITTTNTGVMFKGYPFLAKLVAAVSSRVCRQPESGMACMPSLPARPDFAPEGQESINDAVAGILGEHFHARGRLCDQKRGIYVIVGTGVGGAIMNLDEFPARNLEIGHTFWYCKRTKQYSYRSLEWLEANGYCAAGQYTSKSLVDRNGNEYVYLEHRLAGPGIAIRFAKTLTDAHYEEGELFPVLAQRLNRDFQAGVEADDLRHLEELHQCDRANWASKTNDSIILPVNSLILGTSVENYADVLNDSSPEAELVRRAWYFKIRLFREYGTAMAAIRDTFPDYPVVLGSGVAERMGKDRNFLPVVNTIAGLPLDSTDIQVSFLDAIERESAFIAHKLRAN